MTITEIAKSISKSDRELILNSGKNIRRSRIEVIQDEHDNIDAEIDTQITDDAGSTKRKSVDREWPSAGQVVIIKDNKSDAEFRALVVDAPQRTHKVEFELDNGMRFHSPSPMVKYLLKRRVANGWDYITWF